MIKLTDTLTKKKKELVGTHLTVYNCGPTVYNHIHVGNLRPLILMDILVRYMKTVGKNVWYVMNITDIDDKIINRAKEDNVDYRQISSFYSEQFIQIIKATGCLLPDQMPKVSYYLDEMIDYVYNLVKKGYAYEVDGNVLFDVSKIPEYGAISKQNPTELVNNSRELVTVEKKNPGDFFLWKKSDENPCWNSPWSRGRIGWHTECVYMINNLIGESVTIHGGGVDLKFPHHENENAQNLACYNKSLADVWLHFGTVTVNGVKMSKSLNNFVLAKDALEKYTANDLRYFFMRTKYSQPQDYEQVILDACHNDMTSYTYAINCAKTHLLIADFPLDQVDIVNVEFMKIMSDDFNLPNVLTWLEDLKNKMFSALRGNRMLEVSINLNKLTSHLKILGFDIKNVHDKVVIDLINKWKVAYNQQDYQTSDSIRSQLMEKRIW